MRIALCNALYPTPSEPAIVGGAEVVVRQLAEGLVEAGHEVIAIRTAPDGRRRSETVNGVVVHFLPIRNLFPPFEDRRNPLLRLAWHVIDDRWLPPAAFRGILAEFRPDVLNSHTLNGLNTRIWDVAHSLGIPVVHTLHDYYLTCPRCSRFKDGASCGDTCGSCVLLTSGRRKRAHRVEAFTSVSRRTLDIHIQNGAIDPATPVHIIRNVPNQTIELIDPPLAGGALKVGYIGRFVVEKGVRMLAEAVARLPEGRVELVLAGRVNDDEREHLKALAPSVPMNFLGFVSPNDFYRQVHVMAAPAIWEEPAPLVIQDSIAAGCPLIVTKIGGAPESVEDGVTGWLVDPTVEAIETRLRWLIEHPEALASARSALRSATSRRRSFADLVQEYQAVYETVSVAAAPAVERP